jgi:hypothetical protein
MNGVNHVHNVLYPHRDKHILDFVVDPGTGVVLRG